MNRFITCIELHGVIPEEQVQIYEQLHAQLTEQQFFFTVPNSRGELFQLPVGIYYREGERISYIIVRDSAWTALEKTIAWVESGEKKSSLSGSVFTIEAENMVWSNLTRFYAGQ